MNRLLISYMIIVVYLLLLANISAQSEPEQNCIAKILINTSDSLSLTFLDGKVAGKGKRVSLELSKGKYLLSVKKNMYEWDSKIKKDSLIIDKCDTTFNLYYDFTSDNKIFLNSKPSNAEVYNNDSLLGYTPLSLSGDLYRINLKKDEFEGRTIDLNETQKTIDLELNYLGKEIKPNFFKTNLFKLLLGSAVTLGATAAYFKLKADNNFEKYNSTHDKKYLDNTDRYDVMSGVAFGALQVNFGVLLYYFLKEE